MFTDIPSKILARIFEIWTTPVIEYGVRDDRFYFNLFPIRRESRDIDDRIAQIDLAKKNLLSALSAIDELKHSAETSKAELAEVMERFEKAQAEKAIAEQELESVRGIANNDIEVFKKLAGVPSPRQIAKERLIGFVIGVIASIIASGAWWLICKHWPSLKT